MVNHQQMNVYSQTEIYFLEKCTNEVLSNYCQCNLQLAVYIIIKNLHVYIYIYLFLIKFYFKMSNIRGGFFIPYCLLNESTYSMQSNKTTI